MTQTETKKKKKGWVWAIILILICAGAGYYVFSINSDTESNADLGDTQVEEKVVGTVGWLPDVDNYKEVLEIMENSEATAFWGEQNEEGLYDIKQVDPNAFELKSEGLMGTTMPGMADSLGRTLKDYFNQSYKDVEKGQFHFGMEYCRDVDEIGNIDVQGRCFLDNKLVYSCENMKIEKICYVDIPGTADEPDMVFALGKANFTLEEGIDGFNGIISDDPSYIEVPIKVGETKEIKFRCSADYTHRDLTSCAYSVLGEFYPR